MAPYILVKKDLKKLCIKAMYGATKSSSTINVISGKCTIWEHPKWQLDWKDIIIIFIVVAVTFQHEHLLITESSKLPTPNITWPFSPGKKRIFLSEKSERGKSWDVLFTWITEDADKCCSTAQLGTCGEWVKVCLPFHPATHSLTSPVVRARRRTGRGRVATRGVQVLCVWRLRWEVR